MFDAWKQAWRDAVENFRRELDPDRYAAEADRKAVAMRRDLERARARARHLQAEIDATRRELTREHEEVNRCRHRETLARQIDDHETARIAGEYAARHAERAAVLQQKLNALTAEHALFERDLQAMRQTLAELGSGADILDESAADERAPNVTAEAGPDSTGPARDDHGGLYGTEFERLENEARERAAEAHLEELKRKMR
jgi:hypothetical protein